MLLLIRYGEIHLKGLNRPHFEKLLKNAIKRAISVFPNADVVKGQGRYYVTGIMPDEIQKAIVLIQKIFGLTSVSPAIEIEPNLQSITDGVLKLAETYLQMSANKKIGFKIEVKRADKRFPIPSMELAALLGGEVLNSFENFYVDVVNPNVRFYVEIRDICCCYTEIYPCAGGMPQKSNGRAMLLLSGGIDSPVAGYMTAKRGVELNCVHYYSYPYTGEAAKQKVITLASQLSTYAGRIYLFIVPFTEIQLKIHECCPHDMTVLIMRRFMMKIAEKLANANECKALVTGESIGQVASQTLDSICVTDEAVKMPVFRPLIGMDKIEIIERARKIGTYDTSILPYEDCCTVFVPKHPLTHPQLENIIRAENVLEIDTLINTAVSGTEKMIVN